MYAHHSFSAQAAGDRQRALIAQTERDRKAQQFRNPTPASQPTATRRTGRAWQLLQVLRASAQSL